MPLHAAEAGGVNDSPRERNRILLKRNPIASEYQNGSDLFDRTVTEAADAEGVDFRSLFKAALSEASDDQTIAGLNLSGQTLARRLRPGGALSVTRKLPADNRWIARLGVGHSAAERTVEHYQARWTERNGIGTPSFPRYSQDQYETSRWDATAGILFKADSGWNASYHASYTDYEDTTYRNRLEHQFARGDILPNSVTFDQSGTTITELTALQVPMRRYFHEINTDRRVLRHLLSFSHERDGHSLDINAYSGQWINQRVWEGWNFLDTNQDASYSNASSYLPQVRPSNQQTLYSLEQAQFANFRLYDTETTDQDIGLRAIWDHRLALRNWRPWTSLGFLYRRKSRTNDHDRPVYQPANEGFLLNAVANAASSTRILDGRVRLPAGLSPSQARVFLNDQLNVSIAQNERSSLFETLQDQYETEESVTAVSAGLYHIGKRWQWRAGLRYERTKTRTLGTIIAPPETLKASRIPAIAGLLVNGEFLTDSYADLDGGRVSGTNQYRHWLPSLSIGLTLSQELELKAQLFRQLMRPQYFDIVNYRRVNPPVNSISEGNPVLEPTLIDTIGLAMRWTPASGTVLTFELYKKEVSDFFYDARRNTLVDAEIFQVSRVDNGSDAKLTGFSVDIAQQLDITQSLTSSLSLSYTYSDTSAEILQADETQRVTPLPERSRHLLQGSANVIWQGWNAGVHLRYQSITLDEVGSTAATDIYRDSATIWGFSLTRGLRSAWTVSLRVANLTNTPERSFEGSRSRATNNLFSYEFATLSLSKQF